mgnify:FL=1
MKRILKYLCMGIVIAALTSIQVFADPLSDQLQQQQEQLNSSLAVLREAQQKTQALEKKIQMLDTQIQNKMYEIDKNKEKINKTQSNIEDIENKIKEAEEDLKEEQELYCERIRVVYENGGTLGYLQILLESKGIQDFFYRIDTVRRISQLDREIKESLNKKMKDLDTQKQTLKTEKEKLIALQDTLQQDMDKLKADKANVEELVRQAEEEESRYSAQVEAAQAKVAEITRRIQQIREQQMASSGQSSALSSRGNSSMVYSDDSIVSYALQFLNTPYVWGGTSPSGFDCSGYVQYVYANFGIYLPRTTYSQVNVGTTVSRSELQPGDLVFFGSATSPHHVGIYIGDGMYVHAPRTGDVVKISPLNSYAIAKRVR